MSREEQLVGLLERWDAERARGRSPDAADLCGRCPELEADLRRLLRFSGRLERLREASGAWPTHRAVETQPAGPERLAPASAALPAPTEPLPAWASPLAGDEPALPGYELRARLGEGGMGVVYLARDTLLGRTVAVKVMRPDQSTPGALARFLSEARAVARLDHPNIIKIFQVGEAPQPYLVLEYASGGGLGARLGREPMPPREAARLVLLLARAVRHAHERGIVHRDLKPDNVLLAPPAEEPALNVPLGCPKVTDFGLARWLAGGARATAPGTVLGTPTYMAPEQAEGQTEVGPAADVWALGAILYRLLAGRAPFGGDTVSEVLYNVLRTAPAPLGAAEVPAELEAVCLHCLEKVPERRPTAGELARLLERFQAQEGPATLPLPAARGPAPRLVTRRRALAVGLAGLLGLGGALAWWQTRGGVRLVKEGSAPAPPLKGELDAEVTRPGDADRQMLRLSNRAARPLRPGDEVRVWVKLNRPAYCYVLWVGADGNVGPVYPWLKGDWGRRGPEEPERELHLPQKDGQWKWWPMGDGPGGLETLVLLARDEPLPSEADLKKELAGLGRHPLADPEGLSVAWFENGALVRDEPLRAPILTDVRDGSSPLERVNREVQRRVGRYFTYSRAVTFGCLAEGKES
jgi:serine/threonine-protein kinase